LSGGRASHWEAAYTDKSAEQQSWYQQEPAPSIEAIRQIGGNAGDSLIDVGAGSSPVVLSLANRGWHDLTALDISSTALDRARAAAGENSQRISWINADITAWQPSRTYDIWHDRAVFHFLTEPEDRARYKAALMAGLKPGGHLIIATFAQDGPEKCSGLPVQRYDAAGMAAELGNSFAFISEWRELHRTPFDTQQSFQWCILRRRAV
jgi:2-polyprenyl-3-methyl-5-hydroxy-6-metoxy-1,4-benzoquinol methylase